MVQDGAHILDVNMDDPMLDAVVAMREFLLRLASDPGNCPCARNAGFFAMGSPLENRIANVCRENPLSIPLV